MNSTQELIVGAGVRNLKEFGYPDVNKENIFTDPIYSKFFKSMLDENMGQGVDEELEYLKGLIDPKPVS